MRFIDTGATRRSRRPWHMDWITVGVIALYFFALGGSAWGAEGNHAPPAKPRCGVVVDPALKDSPAVSLFEADMLQNDQIVSVERTDLDKVLQEQQLQTLLSPAGVSDRRSFGHAVRADVLVFLAVAAHPVESAGDRPRVSGSNAQGADHLELVVCESRHGLRLSVVPLTVSKDAAADAGKMRNAFDAALARYRSDVRLVVAVPPFASQDVSYEYDDLEEIYPQVLDEILLQRPGVLAVEVDEAKALADELAISDGPDLQRDLPLYINRKYKHEIIAGRPTITLDLDLKRGTQSLGQFSKSAVPVSEVSAALRDAAGVLLKKISSAPPAVPSTQPENLVEAQELARQAEAFAAVSDWQQARVTAEASLLLDPAQPRLHGIAYLALNKIAIELEHQSVKNMPPMSRINDWGNTAMNPAYIRQAFTAFRASLPHLEAYMEGTTLRADLLHNPEFPIDLFMRRVKFWVGDSYFNAKHWMEMDADANAALLRIIDYKAANKIDDDTVKILAPWIFSDLDLVAPRFMLPQDWIDGRKYDSDMTVSLLERFSFRADKKGLCNIVGSTFNFRLTDESRAGILKRLRADGYANMADLLEQRYAAIAADMARSDRMVAAMRHSTPHSATKPPIANPDVVIEQIAFQQVGLDEPVKDINRHLIGAMKAGPDLDVFWTQSLVFTMSTSEKGTLRLAGGPIPPWPADLHDPHPDQPGWQWLKPDCGCFDGRLAWFFMKVAPIQPYRGVGDYWAVFPIPQTTAWALVAYDLQTKKTYWFGKELGLPPSPTHIVPLAPGKVLVAGFNGRTWCAIASVNPGNGNASRSIKVIYQARISPQPGPEPSADLSIAYPIDFLCPLGAVATGKPGATALPRVLAKRSAMNFLLIDPNIPSVHPLDELLPRTNSAYYVDGKVYFRRMGSYDEISQALCVDAKTLKPDGPILTLHSQDLFFSDGWMILTGKRDNSWSACHDAKPPYLPLRGNELPAATAVFDTNNYGPCTGGSRIIFPTLLASAHSAPTSQPKLGN